MTQDLLQSPVENLPAAAASVAALQSEIRQAVDAPLSPEQLLALTQGYRRGIIKELTQKGVPADASDRAMLMDSLGSLERVAVSQQRIAADKENASGVSEHTLLITKLLNAMGQKPRDATELVEEVRPTPQLGSDVPAPVLVPGETDINPRQMNYDEFMASRPQVPQIEAS